jgi:hypothetical protein
MTHIVNMVRDSMTTNGRDYWSCGVDAWELLLDLGKTFGWKPQGTRYAPADTVTVPDRLALHGYRPGDHQDNKRIAADDALAWAHALIEARSSPHLLSMIGERDQAALSGDATPAQLLVINAPFAAVMDDFIDYAARGEFCFASAE